MDGSPREAQGAPPLSISNVIAAFSEEQAARVTGLTKRRLRYWAKTGFFKPSFSEDNPRLPNSRFYSFRELVALRTLARLRIDNGVTLQHLRAVAAKLSHLKDDLWTATTLHVLDRRVVLENPETGWPEEAVSGQHVLRLPLARVIEKTGEKLAELHRRPGDSIGKLGRRRAILRNALSVAGTRIAVGSIRRLHEDGYSTDRIIEEYPDLTPEDIEAALACDMSKAASR